MHAHPSSGRLQAPESSTNKHPLRTNDGPQRGSQAQLSFCHLCTYMLRVFLFGAGVHNRIALTYRVLMLCSYPITPTCLFFK